MSNLAIGMEAPNFIGRLSTGEDIQLKDFRGKHVVLYFYPKDMTPGCTNQACDFRDYYEEFSSINAVIIGVSNDGIDKHVKFANKYGLPFYLVSDEDKKISTEYGVFKEKKLYGKLFMGIERTTYLINPEGRIAKIYPKVKVKDHVSKVLEDIKNISL